MSSKRYGRPKDREEDKRIRRLEQKLRANPDNRLAAEELEILRHGKRTY